MASNLVNPWGEQKGKADFSFSPDMLVFAVRCSIYHACSHVNAGFPRQTPTGSLVFSVRKMPLFSDNHSPHTGFAHHKGCLFCLCSGMPPADQVRPGVVEEPPRHSSGPSTASRKSMFPHPFLANIFSRQDLAVSFSSPLLEVVRIQVKITSSLCKHPGCFALKCPCVFKEPRDLSVYPSHQPNGT